MRLNRIKILLADLDRLLTRAVQAFPCEGERILEPRTVGSLVGDGVLSAVELVNNFEKQPLSGEVIEHNTDSIAEFNGSNIAAGPAPVMGARLKAAA